MPRRKRPCPPPSVSAELRSELAAIKQALAELRAATVESDARSVAAIETANAVARTLHEQSAQFGELLTATAVSTQMQREIMNILNKFEAAGLLAAAGTSDEQDDAANNQPASPENGVAHDGE